MNKFFITVFILFFLSIHSFAQNRIDNSKTPIYKAQFSFPKHSNTFNKKSTVSDWYSPLSFAFADSIIGNSLTTGIGFLQYDTLSKIVYADGVIGNNNWLSVGRVLDPKDDIIAKTNNPGIQLNKYVGYTLDSIRFTYAYVRNVDVSSVIDTLFISYFKGTAIQKYVFTSSQNKYALVDWRGDSIRFTKNYFAVDTILLTSNDSTGIANTNGNFENYINLKTFLHKVPVGLNVNTNGGYNANNLIAYTLTFKSAIPSVTGTDTAIMLYQKNPTTIPSGSRRTNYFGFYFAMNQDTISWTNQNYFNTSLLVPKWCAYQPSNSCYGYVPGCLFTNEYFIDADFHLTTDNNVSVEEISNNNFLSYSIYPNPSKQNEMVSLFFDLKNNSIISVEVVNLMGQKLKSVSNKNMDAVDNRLDIDLSGMNKGIYFINVTANGFTQTKKLLITE